LRDELQPGVTIDRELDEGIEAETMDVSSEINILDE
jgi:hypothetical protein